MKEKNKKNTEILIAAIVAVFAAHFIDAFLIKSSDSIFSDSIFARIIGLVIIFIAGKLMNKNIRKRCLGGFGWYFEILYGIIFAVVPLALAYGSELIYFRIKGFHRSIIVSFFPPNLQEGRSLGIAFAAFASALLLNVFFKELFRGFIMNRVFGRLSFRKTVLLQAVIMTLLSSVTTLKNIDNFNGRELSDIVITLVASTAATFLSSVKWGYYYHVNGSVWMAIADHFVNSFVLTCVFLSPDRLPDRWLVVKAFVVQVISFLIFIPFYYQRDRINSEMAKEMKTRHDVLSSMNEATEDLDEEKASNNFMMMMNESVQNKKFPHEKETEIVDYDKTPENYSSSYLGDFANSNSKYEVIEPSGKTEIAKEIEEWKKSKTIVGIDRTRRKSPHSESAKHSESRNNTGHKKKRRMRSTQNITDSSESINKLIDEYYNKQMKKNTYD